MKDKKYIVFENVLLIDQLIELLEVMGEQSKSYHYGVDSQDGVDSQERMKMVFDNVYNLLVGVLKGEVSRITDEIKEAKLSFDNLQGTNVFGLIGYLKFLQYIKSIDDKQARREFARMRLNIPYVYKKDVHLDKNEQYRDCELWLEKFFAKKNNKETE